MTVLKLEVVSGLVQFIRKQLLADEVYPTNQRYDEATDTVQYTPDGGTTWIDAPELDPRNQDNIPTRPGTPGPDLACQAAGSVVEYITRYITLVTSLLSASATLVQGITAIIGFLGLLFAGWAILWDLIAGVFATLTGFGASTVTAAMTSTVYEQLLCILSCNMDNHGALDDDHFTAVLNAVDSQIGGTAATILRGILSLMGRAGINRAASFYDTSSDCSGCGCDWCAEWDLTQEPGPIQIDPGGAGVYTPGVGWQAQNGYTSGTFRRFITANIPALTGKTTTEVSVTITEVAGSVNSGASRSDRWADNSATVVLWTNPASGTYVRTWATTRTWTLASFWSFVSSATSATWSGSATLTHLKIKGTGVNPFDRNNCV